MAILSSLRKLTNMVLLKKERERERTGIEGVITVSLLLLVSLEHGLYKGFQIRERVMMQRCKR